ncbi:rolling circle replication-associated protein, partial [Geomonas sp.]|uniref:rolling circle replication-associated protein n=1 Tax=Geomonas sp. TaxID=2651584 RepID=UPI002B4A8AC9
PGSAGGIGGRAELVLATQQQPLLPLPGMERLFPPEAVPLELDYRTITLTKGHSNLSEEAQQLLEKWDKEGAVSRGACLKIFPNGEITGGYYRSGRRSIPKKAEKVISQTFTKQARKTIRRAAECASTEFRLFITLTFDPKQAQLNDHGQVDQKWAKKEFKRFLNTIKKKYDRRLERLGTEQKELSYIWVAEIQEQHTKNIHFHILVDQPFIPVKWLVDIWGQAANSVNVKRLNNQEHAVRYMLKYMGKGHCPIEGKRYGMTQNLLAGMKPQEIRFEGEDKREAFRTVKRNFYWQIEKGGGKVTDFGLFIPAPRREKIWRDKQGKFHKTKAVSRDLGRLFLQALGKPMKKIDWEHEIDGATTDTFSDEVPF